MSLSSGHLEAAPPVARPTFPSIEPDGTMWFQRVYSDEVPAIDASALALGDEDLEEDDLEAEAWEDLDPDLDAELDAAPTLVLPRRRILG